MFDLWGSSLLQSKYVLTTSQDISGMEAELQKKRNENVLEYKKAYEYMRNEETKTINDAVKKMHPRYAEVEKDYKALYDKMPVEWNKMETTSSKLVPTTALTSFIPSSPTSSTS